MTRAVLLLLSTAVSLCSTTTAAFAVGDVSSRSSSAVRSRWTTMAAALPQQDQATTSTNDDILKPPYEIEPIPTRIGHGFDIHRMAPIEEAGQPIVIGGVVIPHSDQKVSWCSLRSVANLSLSQRLTLTTVLSLYTYYSGLMRRESMWTRVVFTKLNWA